MPHVGAPLKRPDDPRLLTGRGRYVDDITLPRMVHVAFVRSPHAHAAITRIDVSAAAKSPGVVVVLTGVEAARLCRPYRGILQHYHGMKTGAMTPLALERVRCVGEPVVAIAAETAAAAHDAAARVRVDYAPLPAVLDPDSVTAPLIHPELVDNIIYETSMRGGEPDAAFAAAPRVWRGRFTTGRHTGVPMEPRGLVADFEPATRALTVWISTQVPHMMQAVLAGLFDLTEHRVRVIAPDVGGSFGIKIHVYQDDLAAVALALRLGRAVKFVATRRESFVSDIHAREQTIDVEVAGGDDGVVTAMRARIVAAVGPYSAYPRSSVVEGGQVLRMLPGPYRVRHYAGTLRGVAQNKVITSQYRAVGHPIAAAVTDQGQGAPTAFAQIVADELGISPDSVAVRSGDTALMPYGGGTWASRGMPIGGSATLLAARALAERIRGVAATLLEAHADDIRLSDGRVAVSGAPDRGMTLGDLARTVHFRSNELKGLEPNLEATVHFTNAQPWTFTNGAHLAVVEVDTETGRVSVLRYVAVDDCGRVVNPALVEGQTAGGVAQGLGGALMEHCAYDGAGQPLCGTLMDYAVPTAADVPPLELHHLETPAPSIAGGYKGAGEAGTTGAPAAILNAVNDALAPFGVMITDQPITAERVVRAVREGGRRRGR